MRRACSKGLLALELTALPWIVFALLSAPEAGTGARRGTGPSDPLPPPAAVAIATPFSPLELAVAVRFDSGTAAAGTVALPGGPGWLEEVLLEERRLPGRRARVAAAPEPSLAGSLALAWGLRVGLRRLRQRRTGSSRSSR
jgi:hypothetical protein